MLLSISVTNYTTLNISKTNERLIIRDEKIIKDKYSDPFLITSGKNYYTEKCMSIIDSMSKATVGHADSEIKEFMKGFPFIDGDISEFSKRIALFYKETKDKTQNVYVFNPEGDLFVFMQRSMSDRLNHILSFKSPNEEVSNMIRKTFHIIKENPRIKISYSVRYADESNFYRWMLPPAVFETLLYGANLRFEGKPVYTMFTKKKANGKVREIYAPDANVKTALKRVNNILTSAYEKRNISFQVAYKTGKSIVDNANPHKNNPYMVKIDISNFFPSCKRELVKKYLRFMFLKTEEKLLDEFLDIVLVNDALVIGAPISGIIANTIISTPVAAMKKRCDKCGVAFTVYADDMTFSSETFLRKEFVQEIFNTSMSLYKLDEYFKINPEKIVGISNHRRRVTGVSINSKDELCVKRRMYRDIRSILERMSHKKPVTYSKKEISGKLAFVIMIENSVKVNALLEKYKDILISEKLMSEKTLEKRGIHV